MASKRRSSSARLGDAVDALAQVVEGGELLLATDPAGLFEAAREALAEAIRERDEAREAAQEFRDLYRAQGGYFENDDGSAWRLPWEDKKEGGQTDGE